MVRTGEEPGASIRSSPSSSSLVAGAGAGAAGGRAGDATSGTGRRLELVLRVAIAVGDSGSAGKRSGQVRRLTTDQSSLEYVVDNFSCMV